nr:hypothetical protein [Tanacetum cinerariifolium]
MKVKNQPRKTIKALRLDRERKYISQEFKDYLKYCGIVQQLTPPYTPQHNGVSERRNRTLLDMVRSVMNLTTLPLSFCDYALETATCILNMVPTKKVDKTLYKLWYEKVLNLSYLKIRGCEALVKRDTPGKLQQRFVKCIFIGYPKETMGYYFYFPPENKLVVAMMDTSKRGYIPIQERLDLNKTQGASIHEEVKRMQNVPYASAVGSIMYEMNIIAASKAAMEAVWIRKFILGLGIVPTINEPIKMFCDNAAALLIANELGVQRGAKHYYRRYHYIHECIELGEINLLKVHTDDNLTDPFTKALSKGKLTQHARSMGLRLEQEHSVTMLSTRSSCLSSLPLHTLKLKLKPHSFSLSSSSHPQTQLKNLNHPLWSGLQTWRTTSLNHNRFWGPSGPQQPSTVLQDYEYLVKTELGSVNSLAEVGSLVLSTKDPVMKSRLSHFGFQRWVNHKINVGVSVPPDKPARPAKPQLVSPKEIPAPKNSGLPLNAYMLHNLAHVELNAIDLAWDTVVRFSPYHELLGDMFFADFARVADDESRHFAWCSQRLAEIGFSYGDMPAHNLLWRECEKSSDDVVARLAVIPLVQGVPKFIFKVIIATCRFRIQKIRMGLVSMV